MDDHPWQSPSQRYATILEIVSNLEEALLWGQQLAQELASELTCMKITSLEDLEVFNRNEEEQELVI